MQDEILQNYEIRKSNKQKTEFIEYMKTRLSGYGYDSEKDIRVEEKGHGLFKSRNIVVGNPEEAKVLFGGHYDTCAWMPFPNFMAPTNPVLFWGYQILLTVMILVSTAFVGFVAGLIFDNATVAYFAFLFALIALMIQLMVGFRNKHTANDNSSGIITLTHILETLPEDQRKKVCVIYFDNEEKGLFGSAFFYKKHKKQIKDKLLINFDCVGDGENIVTMADGKCRKDEKYQLFVEALKKEEADADVKYLCRKMKFMMFPSDQMNFKKGIGVCSLKKSPIGLYVARIHTYFDTKCREENVEYLTKAMVAFVEKL
ncbi:MAG: M28 family peptidase [Lachnospiraceae bacterium]|nr:M28 family peptidase [Lachnospiraceae bacterium]